MKILNKLIDKAVRHILNSPRLYEHIEKEVKHRVEEELDAQKLITIPEMEEYVKNELANFQDHIKEEIEDSIEINVRIR